MSSVGRLVFAAGGGAAGVTLVNNGALDNVDFGGLSTLWKEVRRLPEHPSVCHNLYKQ